AQSGVWTAGYVLMALLIAACALGVRRAARAASAGAAGLALSRSPLVAVPAARALGADVASDPIAPARRLRWLLLAFVPSSMMLGVTSHITTDVAAIPLLWVIPLAIY